MPDAPEHPDTPDPTRAEAALLPGGLTVTTRRDGPRHTVSLFGELDLASAGDVERALRHVEATGAESIVVDLAGLTFMDSTGVRLVMSAQARSRADAGRLEIRRGPAAVQRVFEICGVDRLLPFVE